MAKRETKKTTIKKSIAKKNEEENQQQQQQQQHKQHVIEQTVFKPDEKVDLFQQELNKIVEKSTGMHIESLEDLDFAPFYISTGNYALNWAISGKLLTGGIPAGKIIEVYGPPSSGKSLIETKLCGEMIKKGGLAYVIETEDAANKKFAQIINQDKDGEITKRIQRTDEIDTIEQLKTFLLNIADAKMAKKNNTPIIVVVDSISQLSSDKEMSDSLKGKDTKDMTRAQAMRSVFRTISRKLRLANITIFNVSHTSALIGGFGDPVTSSSHGQGAKFASSVIMYITSSKEIKNAKEIPVGVKMNFKIMKNRIVFKGRKASVSLLFNGGILPYSGLLELLDRYEVIKLSSKEITSTTKFFINYKEIKLTNKNREKYETDSTWLIEKKGKVDYAYKGDAVRVVDLKKWINEKGGKEAVLNKWENELNAIMEQRDPDSDNPEFIKEEVSEEPEKKEEENYLNELEEATEVYHG